MFSTLDEQTKTTEQFGSASRLQRFVRMAGVAVVTGILFGALYLGILFAE